MGLPRPHVPGVLSGSHCKGWVCGSARSVKDLPFAVLFRGFRVQDWEWGLEVYSIGSTGSEDLSTGRYVCRNLGAFKAEGLHGRRFHHVRRKLPRLASSSFRAFLSHAVEDLGFGVFGFRLWGFGFRLSGPAPA